jgi:hypothetical protein
VPQDAPPSRIPVPCAPQPLVRRASTLALLAGALDTLAVEPCSPPGSPPSIPSLPPTPPPTALSLPPAVPARELEAQTCTLELDVPHAALWDVDPSTGTDALVRGRIILDTPPTPSSARPLLDLELSCHALPAPRGVRRATRAHPVADVDEQEAAIPVAAMLAGAWVRVSPPGAPCARWAAPLELRVPAALLCAGATRTLSLHARAVLAGGGGAIVHASAAPSVSALSTPAELGQAPAERKALARLAEERAARAAAERAERVRLVEKEIGRMGPREGARFRAWLDASGGAEGWREDDEVF